MDYSKGIKNVDQLNNDILMEILVRLPPKQIFKFTCVSKRWNDLIMDPCFFKLYRQRTTKLGFSSCRLLGFVQCNKNNNHYLFGRPRHWKHRFLSVSSDELGGGSFFQPKRGCFITSSTDGLFLWGVIPTEFYFLSRRIPTEYHVGNPITKRWVTLPPPPPPLFPDRSISVGLASNIDVEGITGNNINFRVVVATGTDELYEYRGAKTMPIQTYSSRTGRWRRSKLISEKPISISIFESPTVIGRVFHWITTSHDYLVVYDSSLLDEEDDEDCKSGSQAMPTNRDNSNNKKKKCVLELIALPFEAGSKVIWRTDNGQTLWYGVGGTWRGNGVRIFRLEMGGGGKHDKDDWRLVNKVVDADTLKKDIIGISSKEIMEMEMKRRQASWIRRDDDENLVAMIRSYREAVRVIAFVPWDTRLVIVRLWERVFVYDWENQRMDEVKLHGRPYYTDVDWEWYPYFHSLSLSPYAFLLRKNQQ